MTDIYRQERLQQITAARRSLMRDIGLSLFGIAIVFMLFYLLGMLH